MGLCSPWITPADIQLCAEGLDPDRLQRAIDAASDLLWMASGRRFPGLCTDVVRPCAQQACVTQWLASAFPDGAPRPLPVGHDDCACAGDVITCACRIHSAVKLPNVPVVDVVEILVDGQPLPAGSWLIIDDEWLVRRGGHPWPCCQRLDLPATEPGTWQVSYRWGAPPPAAGLLAAEVLACELAKSWTPGCSDCRLPRRVTSLVREGVSMAVLDPFDFLAEGGFGIYEVDAFLRVYPGDRGKLISPRAALRRPRRVR